MFYKQIKIKWKIKTKNAVVVVVVGEVILVKANRATSSYVDSLRFPLAANELIVPFFIRLLRMTPNLAVAAKQLSQKECVGMAKIATI